jgi:hypothetical protein
MMTSVICPLSSTSALGSAGIVASGDAVLGACCSGSESQVPCIVQSSNRERGEALSVSRCVFPEGGEVKGESPWSAQVRSAVCGQASGQRAAIGGAGSNTVAHALLLSHGTANHMQAVGGESLAHPDPAQALSVALNFSAARPFSMDRAQPVTGCTMAALQQAQVATEFRRRRQQLEERLRAACQGGGSRFRESEACVAERADVAAAYASMQEVAENAARDVVLRCFPSAGEPGTLDALAAEVFTLAAVPGKSTASEPLGEDARFCSLRADAARYACATVPSRLVEPQLRQIAALCGVDASAAQAENPTDALGAAERALRQGATSGDFGGNETLQRWCPVLLSAAADNVASLRARFTVNPAIGRAESMQCANLTAAATCLGPGGVERIGRVSALDEEQGGTGAVPTGPEDGSGSGGAEDDGGSDGDSRVLPPADVAARPGAAADTLNFFADVADKSRSSKAEAIGAVQRLVTSSLPRVRVERMDPDEIPTNANLNLAEQHRNTCLLHCHARDEELGGGAVMNCRLFTPSEPSVACTKAVVSVVDESSVPAGTRMEERAGPAYDTIRGFLNGFVGCNVDRAGTENGVPVGAVNVRMEPFGASRWKESGARYGFCYMERDQVAAGPGAEQVSKLANLRQPSGNYMLAFATSRGRDGGRMAPRECKMLLDLHQNVCRHKYANNLDRLPGYTRDCANVQDRVEVAKVGITVPTPSGDQRTVFVPIYEYPKKACELQKLSDACGRISNFAIGEPELMASGEHFGVPDSSDFHCPAPTAGAAAAASRMAGAQQRSWWGARAGSSGVALGRQEYETTQWADMDRDRVFSKEDLTTGCEATCLLYHDYLNPAERELYDDCVTRCFAELQV